MRALMLIVAVLCLGSPVAAERFMGRKIEVVDGRFDANSAAPLVIVLHGFLGNGTNMRKKTRFGAFARREGFVAVFPNGRGRRWNDGRSPGARVNDVGFLSQLIGALVASGQADPAQVYIAGHSNGGGMAMRMACDRPDLIAGIAVVATKSALAYQCAQGRPVPALFVHGIADPISPHVGRRADSRLGGALSSDATFALWRARNQCRGQARVQHIDRVDDGTRVQITDFGRCAAALRTVVIEGHGHGWPGAAGRRTGLQGPATQEVDGTDLSWSFFRGL